MDTPGYYLERADGEGDIFVCAPCVQAGGKSTDHPADPEVLRWAPIGCGVHVYGANLDDYI